MRIEHANRYCRILKTVLCVSIIINFQFSIFNSAQAQRPKKKPAKPAPTVISAGDLLTNYGLDTTLVSDTAAAARYLD